jgi:hypothetical protein
MRKAKKQFTKDELLHGKHLWDMTYEKGVSVTNLREEMRELLKLAAEVVTTSYIAQDQAIDELEEFLR